MRVVNALFESLCGRHIGTRALTIQRQAKVFIQYRFQTNFEGSEHILLPKVLECIFLQPKISISGQTSNYFSIPSRV